MEATRASKMNIKLDKPIDALKKYVGGEVYVTFSTLNKVGVNPKITYFTPVGIYAYILDDEFIQQFSSKSIEFAADRPFIHVLRPTAGANIVHLQSVTQEQALELINATQDHLKHDPFRSMAEARSTISKAHKSHKGGNYTNPESPGAMFWFWTYHVTNRKPLAWNVLLRNIGVDGIVDHGDGIIHPDQPAQAVFLSKPAIEHIATIDNPQSSGAETPPKVINFSAMSKDLQASFMANASRQHKTPDDFEFRVGILNPNGFLEKRGRYYQAYNVRSKRLQYADGGYWLFYN
jgi:hypothetical protein